jgi:type I site-specific restriction-modification system R (restriction) subunit
MPAKKVDPEKKREYNKRYLEKKKEHQKEPEEDKEKKKLEKELQEIEDAISSSNNARTDPFPFFATRKESVRELKQIELQDAICRLDPKPCKRINEYAWVCKCSSEARQKDREERRKELFEHVHNNEQESEEDEKEDIEEEEEEVEEEVDENVITLDKETYQFLLKKFQESQNKTVIQEKPVEPTPEAPKQNTESGFFFVLKNAMYGMAAQQVTLLVLGSVMGGAKSLMNLKLPATTTTSSEQHPQSYGTSTVQLP